MMISEVRNSDFSSKGDFYNQKHLIKINLQFFDEKTEKPTEKRKEKAVKDGQFAVSKDLVTAVSIIMCFTALKLSVPNMYEKIADCMVSNFNLVEDYDILWNDQYFHTFGINVMRTAMSVIAPVALTAMISGVIMNLLQTGWHPSMERLKLNFKTFEFENSMKRVFSKKNVVEAGLSFFKFLILGILVYNKISAEIFMIQNLIYVDLVAAIIYIGELCFDVALSVGYTFLILSVFDLIYQRFSHAEKLKMSKNDIKDERKQSEGDPLVKAKIRQKMREAALTRMMSSVPQADVVITNPTHYAIAISYDREKEGAPIVVAKGKDHLAMKIKQCAKDNDVEIVENKPLARALYASVEVNREIPPELYQAVAEVLAFVYKLKNKV